MPSVGRLRGVEALPASRGSGPLGENPATARDGRRAKDQTRHFRSTRRVNDKAVGNAGPCSEARETPPDRTGDRHRIRCRSPGQTSPINPSTRAESSTSQHSSCDPGQKNGRPRGGRTEVGDEATSATTFRKAANVIGRSSGQLPELDVARPGAAGVREADPCTFGRPLQEAAAGCGVVLWVAFRVGIIGG